MGIIGNQPERNSFDTASPIDLIDESIHEAKSFTCKFSVSDLIEAKKALEMERANEIAVQDGNYRDEHMAGIADRMEMISDAIGGENEITIAMNRVAAALEKIVEKMP